MNGTIQYGAHVHMFGLKPLGLYVPKPAEVTGGGQALEHAEWRGICGLLQSYNGPARLLQPDDVCSQRRLPHLPHVQLHTKLSPDGHLRLETDDHASELRSARIST